MSEPVNMFDPAHYAAVRRPAMEAETLPPWCYTSRAFYEREIEKIFRQTWNMVGREELVPKPGDFFTLDLADIPIIIVRGRDNTVRAFSNVCAHRGTRLLDGTGNCGSHITCPYHSWSYRLDGTLAAAAGMQDTINFDKGKNGLVPVRLESYGGFLFVNFNPNAESLVEYLGDFPDQLGSYNFDDLVCTRVKRYDIACNWKVYVENQREAYHVPTVHRTSLGPQPAVQIETRGNWSGSFIKKDSSEGVLRGEVAPFPRIPTLTGRAAEGINFALIYPHCFMGFSMDCVWWMECRPYGPSQTAVVVGSCFPKSTVARPDFEQNVEKYYRRWDVSHPEDNAISELVQRGLSSPLARPGRYAPLEKGVHRISNWILDRVIGPAH